MGQRQFLVIDDNADSRFLLVKTLLRKFPDSLVKECQDSDLAVAAAREGAIDAIVAHRATDVDGPTLIRLLREANAEVPLVLVSGIDRSQAAIAAGASAFLSYDEWLRIGSLVVELIANRNAVQPPDRR